jgi:hypothetical protein
MSLCNQNTGSSEAEHLQANKQAITPHSKTDRAPVWYGSAASWQSSHSITQNQSPQSDQQKLPVVTPPDTSKSTSSAAIAHNYLTPSISTLTRQRRRIRKALSPIDVGTRASDIGNNAFPSSTITEDNGFRAKNVVHHLLEWFNKPQFSDYMFVLNLPEAKGATVYYLNSAVVSASTFLASRVNRHVENTHRKYITLDGEGRILDELTTTLPNLSHGAVTAALRVLYGDNPRALLEDAINGRHEPEGDKAFSTSERMVRIMKFFVAGIFLRVDDIVDTALRIIPEELNFFNLEYALSFALSEHANASDYDPLDGKWHDRKVKGTMLGLGRSIYGNATETILGHCLNYLIINFPCPFFLDEQAPISYVLGAFRAQNDGFESNLHPRAPLRGSLYSIEFGSHTSVTRIHRRISTILLSVPFKLLSYLYDHLQYKGKDVDFQKVVSKRNARSDFVIRNVAIRHGLLKADSLGMPLQEIPKAVFAYNLVPDRAKWVETLEGEKNGWKLTRSYIGQCSGSYLSERTVETAKYNPKVDWADEDENEDEDEE